MRRQPPEQQPQPSLPLKSALITTLAMIYAKMSPMIVSRIPVPPFRVTVLAAYVFDGK